MQIPDWINDAVSGLAQESWYHGERVVDSSLVWKLQQWMDDKDTYGDFKSAGVGKGAQQQTNEAIRRDRILWLPDELGSGVLSELFVLIEAMRAAFNRELYAGLESFEGHFAIYPPGGFYKRHIDTFRDDDVRRISFVLYLNKSWKPSQGGELRLYLEGDREAVIAPQAGSLVLFDSRRFPHEVLLSQAERLSFTGWFKVRGQDSNLVAK